MHVLIITQQWAPELGVPQLRGAWMVRALQQAGHSVSVVTAPPHYPTGKLSSPLPEHQAGAIALGANGELVYRSNFREHSPSIPSRIVDQAVISTSSVAQAMRAINDQRPDLILASAPPLPSAFTARAVSLRTGIPYVVDLRDAWPELARYVGISDSILLGRTTLRGKLRTPVIDAGAALFSRALRGASGLIATSQVHAAHLALQYHKPTSALSNIVIERERAAEEETYAPARPAERFSLLDGPLARPLRVLYAGTVGRAQGIENVLWAAYYAKNAGYPIELTVVGNGAHLKVVKSVAKHLGVDADFRGRVSREEAHQAYEETDVALVHLKAWEPLQLTVPSKTFEAIASGRYVIGVLAGAAADIITRAGAGSVVTPEDPEALGQTFVQLANEPWRLSVNEHGDEWIDRELLRLDSEHTFVDFLEKLVAQR